jgi:flagellar protein FliS
MVTNRGVQMRYGSGTAAYGGGAAAYRETQVMSSSPEQLIPLLYERLLVHLRRAEIQIEAKDFAGKSESLGKASEIVFELLSNLSFDEGGELASRLAALYAFFINELNEAGRSMDTARLRTVTEMVGSLHTAWANAAETLAAGSRDPRAGGAAAQ